MTIRSRTFVVVLSLLAFAVPALAQVYGDNMTAAQKIAVLQKGKPASVSPDDWELMQIGFFSRLQEDPFNAPHAVIPVMQAALNSTSPQVAESAAGALLKIDPIASRARALATLAKILKGDEDQPIYWALDDLGSLYPLAPDAESALVDFIKGKGESRLRSRAVMALAGVPPARVPATVALLTSFLTGQDSSMKIAAAETLGRFGPPAAASIPALRTMLTDRDGRTRIVGATALARIERPPSPSLAAVFTAEFTSTFETDRTYAVRGLAAMGPAARATEPALMKLRETADASLKHDIDEALERIGVTPPAAPPPPAKPSVRDEAAAALQNAIEQLQSPDVATRRSGLYYLDKRGIEAAAAFTPIAQLLKDKEITIRYLAAFVLTSIDPSRATISIPMLTEMLRSDEPIPSTTSRTLGWGGLARLGRPGADLLVSALKDPSAETRAAAASGLSYSDEYPPTAPPALITTARDPDENVRSEALETLWARRLPAAQLVPVFSAALRDTSALVRGAAATGLADAGTAASPALAALRKLVSDPDLDVRLAAATAVVSIDRNNAKDLLPLLLTEFSAALAIFGADPGAEYRMVTAAQGLGRLGPIARDALPALERAWASKPSLAHGYAGVAIALIDPPRRPAIVDGFIAMLAHEDFLTADVLARLEELGPLAAAAAPAVEPYRAHTDPIARKAAEAALAAMRGPAAPPVPATAAVNANPCANNSSRPAASYLCRVDSELRQYLPERSGQIDNDRWLDLAISELETASALSKGTPDYALALQKQIDLHAPPYKNDLKKAEALLVQLVATTGPGGTAGIELAAVREAAGISSSAYIDPNEQRQYAAFRVKWAPRRTSRTVSAPSSSLQAPKPLPPRGTPAIIKQVPPVYPSIAQSARVQGVVGVEVLISETGTVLSAKILKSIPMLDQAALEAVKQWVFAPPIVDGKPGRYVTTVSVEFYLR